MSAETTLEAVSSAFGAARAVRARAYLVVRVGDESRIIDVREGDDIVLGRAPEATVQLDDPRASRAHARIEATPEGLVLHDLGSRNGTGLNRERIHRESRPLAPGDVLWIGDAEILVAGTTEVAPSAKGDGPEIPGVVVADEAMIEVYRLVERVSASSSTVLLLGETGVGKEVVAQQIHQRSARAERPFVRINCGALPENLVESELFGYERGAFTGADRRKIGLFETADGGTLFLDEIGELRLDLQAKLLRALESRRFTRVGGLDEVAVDARIVVATNRDLEAEVKAGRFRGDLFFRLSTIVVEIPPLRERPNEIVLLAELFVREIAFRLGRAAPRLSEPARSVLVRRDWPGNVRELRNQIERALVLADGGVILPEHFADSLREKSVRHPTASIRSQLASIEREAIERALETEGGNQTRAAKRLGISRRTLIYRMEKYALRFKGR